MLHTSLITVGLKLLLAKYFLYQTVLIKLVLPQLKGLAFIFKGTAVMLHLLERPV